MSGRTRNLSPWAYWRLQLDSVVADDPLPDDDVAIGAWRGRVRERLHALLGADPDAVALDVEVTERVECDGYTRERVLFDSESTMTVPAYLLVPHGRTKPGPAMLAVHGHGAGKSAICSPEVDGDEAYAHWLATRGYVVLAPDLRCFGERSDPQWEEPGKYECDWNLVAATMAGRNPLAQNLWDMRRAVDVLAAHPLVNPARIGACGLSYGGTMTLFLAALDERVRAAVVSCYLSSWQSAHRVPWNMCGSQIMTGMLGRLEHVDVAALIAPRPMLAESGRDDFIFPVDAARATIEDVRRVYRAVGAPDDAVVHDVFEGGHQWHGTEAYKFLDRHL
jgi:dienelactone hydrolase